MDTIECIMTRRSVRKFDAKKPVEWEKIGKLLDAGRYAPSSGNLQNWKFIVVSDPGKRKTIAEASAGQNFIADAPYIIVIIAEPEKASRFYGIRGERLYTIQNCAAAAENMLLAAHSLGLGSCWIGAFDENKVSAVLNLIKEVRPQIILPIGYALEVEPAPQKFRAENVTYLEEWWGRLKDADAFLGRTSGKVMKAIDKGGEILEKVNKKLRKE